jgi:hypothetical protein
MKKVLLFAMAAKGLAIAHAEQFQFGYLQMTFVTQLGALVSSKLPFTESIGGRL